MGLNVWLYLRQNGLEDGKNLQLIDGDNKPMERVRHVMSGVFDATFVGNVDQIRARKLGARVVKSVRRVVVHLPASFPFLPTFRKVALAVAG